MKLQRDRLNYNELLWFRKVSLEYQLVTVVPCARRSQAPELTPIPAMAPPYTSWGQNNEHPKNGTYGILEKIPEIQKMLENHGKIGLIGSGPGSYFKKNSKATGPSVEGPPGCEASPVSLSDVLYSVRLFLFSQHWVSFWSSSVLNEMSIAF